MSFHGGSNRYLDEHIPVCFLKKKKKKVSQHGIVVSISRCQEILRNLEILISQTSEGVPYFIKEKVLKKKRKEKAFLPVVKSYRKLRYTEMITVLTWFSPVVACILFFSLPSFSLSPSLFFFLSLYFSLSLYLLFFLLFNVFLCGA